MLIYQYFCGRQEEADLIKDQGKVFKKMWSFDWDKLAKAGFEVVYLLGIWDYRGPLIVTTEDSQNVSDNSLRVPSIFAVSNHTEPHPDLGTRKDLIELIKIIQTNKLKVMVDFVPNQTATTHTWVKEHPEYYQRENNGFKAAFSGDVYLLDYQNQQLRFEMGQILREIVSYGIDGIRCDMAHWVPLDFWDDSIPKLKEDKPDLIMLAEAYSDSIFNWLPLTDLMTAGFNLVYHEFPYRLMKQVWNDNMPIEYFTGHINYLPKMNTGNTLVNYLANHDDPILPNILRLNQAMTSLLIMLPGSMLIPNGQLNNFDHRLAHHTAELLPKEYSELTNLPVWFSNLVQVKKVFSPEYISAEIVNTKVIKLNLVINGNSVYLIANLSLDPFEYTGVETGILHNLGTGSVLRPGEAELFI
jgi:alpha-amylase